MKMVAWRREPPEVDSADTSALSVLFLNVVYMSTKMYMFCQILELMVPFYVVSENYCRVVNWCIVRGKNHRWRCLAVRGRSVCHALWHVIGVPEEKAEGFG